MFKTLLYKSQLSYKTREGIRYFQLYAYRNIRSLLFLWKGQKRRSFPCLVTLHPLLPLSSPSQRATCKTNVAKCACFHFRWTHALVAQSMGQQRDCTHFPRIHTETYRRADMQTCKHPSIHIHTTKSSSA